jgi:ribonuclease HI
MRNKVTIFTDGSSRGNPGRGGWGAIAVYPDSKDEMRVDELGGREDNTTNNRMEMTAALMALSNFNNYYCATPGVAHPGLHNEDISYTVHTDSSYLINGITKWVKGWEKNNWMTAAKQPVINKDLWQKLLEVTKDKKVEWKYIAGHSGIPANERCDEIATLFADSLEQSGSERSRGAPLYKGPLSSYPVDVTNFEGHLIGKKKPDKRRSKAAAFSYISFVDGRLSVDKTWKECEMKVKGKKGARYKKALTPSEEKEIVKEFLKGK